MARTPVGTQTETMRSNDQTWAGLHTSKAIVENVNRPFISLHARAICHSTEDLEKVKLAMYNALGEVPLDIKSTEGHHGNSITVIESSFDSPEKIGLLFSRLSAEDLASLRDSSDARVDESCNVFVRLDKQQAYRSALQVTTGEDAISLRLRISAFPKKRDVAVGVFREFIDSEIAGRCGADSR